MDRYRRSVEAEIRELGLDLSYAKCEWVGDYRMWKSSFNRIIVVGYLVHDPDCDDPIGSYEGMGKITEDLTVIDLYSDGPLLQSQYDYIARLRGVESYELFGEDVDDLALDLWREAFERGKIGTPYARALREKYHGGFDECNVDDAIRGRCSAVWIPDKALEEHLETIAEECRRDEAEKIFKSILEEYNRWADGDCYGYAVDVFSLQRQRGHDPWYERIDDLCDSCWGYIGSEYALEEMQRAFENLMKDIKKPLKIKGVSAHDM